METGSARETEALGARLAARLHAGDTVLVSGELGSGKTTFVRGACRALGVTEAVTSPTFTIGHLYAGDVRVAHLDLYRFVGWVQPIGEISSRISTTRSPSWSGPKQVPASCPPGRVSVSLVHVMPEQRLVRLDAAERALLEGLERADPRVRHGN